MKALGKGSIASIVQVGLAIAWYVLWFAAFALGLAALAYGAVLIMIQAGMIDGTVLTGGDGAVRIGEDGGDFHLTYDNPGGATWPIVVPAMLIGGVAIGGYLVIVGALRKLFDSFTSGEPFHRENARHLRVIWIAMLVIECARYLLMAVAGALITVFEPGVRASFEFDLNISTWAAILILIVLAEVFRVGTRLKEEQELTI